MVATTRMRGVTGRSPIIVSTELSDVRALVVGLGSIGGKHMRALVDLGAAVEVVTRRPAGADVTVHGSIEAALEQGEFDYCVVSSATSEHAADVAALAEAGFGGVLLVEKPLTASSAEAVAGSAFERVGVGYNLRFHPAVAWLERQLGGEPALVADLAAQSYLPEWRPGRDHRETASATRARGGNLGELGVDAETAVSAVLELERAPAATLRLSYLDRLPERRIRVTTVVDTIEADLLSGACRTPAAEESHPVDWPKTYADLHLAMLGRAPGEPCTLGQAQRVVACVERIEQEIAASAVAR